MDSVKPLNIKEEEKRRAEERISRGKETVVAKLHLALNPYSDA